MYTYTYTFTLGEVLISLCFNTEGGKKLLFTRLLFILFFLVEIFIKLINKISILLL